MGEWGKLIDLCPRLVNSAPLHLVFPSGNPVCGTKAMFRRTYDPRITTCERCKQHPHFTQKLMKYTKEK